MRSSIFRALTGVLAVLSFSAVQAHAMNHDMNHDMAQHTTMQAHVYHAQGVIKKITPQSVSIAHKAIPDLNWPPMTMQFDLSEAAPSQLAVGEKVDFAFVQNANGYQIVSLTPQE